MIARLKQFADAFLGRGEHGITIPVLDGAFLPNDKLDRVPFVVRMEGVDNLVATDGRLFFSVGQSLWSWRPGGQPEEIYKFDSSVSALGWHADIGVVAGLEQGGVVSLGETGMLRPLVGPDIANCPVSLCFLDGNTLVVANGSRVHAASDWKRDFLSRQTSGSLLKLDIDKARLHILAERLAFPHGLCATEGGKIVFSEAWAYRLSVIDPEKPGRIEIVCDDLPGYPCRIARMPNGNYSLAFLSVRRQLTEFVLRERHYRQRMMTEIEPEFWIGPSLASGRSFREPLQQGSLKALNIVKPWAPSQSYGLIAELDADFNPVTSYQSRADGNVHGITSICAFNGEKYAASRSANGIVKLDGIGEAPNDANNPSS